MPTPTPEVGRVGTIARRLFLVAIAIALIPTAATAQDPFTVSTSDTMTSEEAKQETPSQVELFRQQLLGFNSTGTQTNGNVAVNVIQYRLFVYTKERPDSSLKRYYLPLILMTKLHTDYNNNQAAADDATAYDGSVATFRLMPMKAWDVGKENKFIVGLVADGRLIAYEDTTEADTQFGGAFYGALGLTYTGFGDAREATGPVYDGRWSTSLMAYLSTAPEAIQHWVFASGNTVWGAELMFRFDVTSSEATKFNLFASVKYMSESVASTDDKFIYKFSIGN